MFTVLENLTKSAHLLSPGGVLKPVLNDDEVKNAMINANQEQMLSGMGADGNSLPKYVDDPYFKTQKKALAYQAWKSHISPDTEKDEEVMDFYIDGTFHSTLKVSNTSDGVEMDSDSPIASSVNGKAFALGLNDDSLSGVMPTIEPLVLKNICNGLGL